VDAPGWMISLVLSPLFLKAPRSFPAHSDSRIPRASMSEPDKGRPGLGHLGRFSGQSASLPDQAEPCIHSQRQFGDAAHETSSLSAALSLMSLFRIHDQVERPKSHQHEFLKRYATFVCHEHRAATSAVGNP
jgi:hypothetical protein